MKTNTVASCLLALFAVVALADNNDGGRKGWENRITHSAVLAHCINEAIRTLAPHEHWEKRVEQSCGNDWRAQTFHTKFRHYLTPEARKTLESSNLPFSR